MHAPQTPAPGFIAKRLEGNSYFDRVAVVGQYALRLHDYVNAEIFVLSFGAYGVGLHAQRIEEKLVGFALVVEGVKEEANVIVVENLIALCYRRAHLSVIIEGAKRYV